MIAPGLKSKKYKLKKIWKKTLTTCVVIKKYNKTWALPLFSLTEWTNIKINKKDNNKSINVVDVCTILEKCSIDEISKYLLDQGKKKDFPDLTIRQ